ncbi:hypothetical protein CC2G_011910 [Coprinopsis cinerea AmutBmut pab1-1]|nr:hypothetical protein CC2G_011910 [Coprinopsis cinerea AmutBmut pab1-1]
MSRVPPCLLYLAIYNPTLSPEKVPGDEVDEDAEEQAHILFYTSKERAVSRDRMLRQIGLAKALVNFSELFDPHNDCETVHSQSRRMVMVSPEPNFWINASIELPKRLSQSSRSKEAASKKSKGKDKDTASSNKATAPAYDYDDGTVHDIVLQMQLLQGYEKFKLLHGSFASILAELGQEALELQLERFFTVWAWSWNLEEKPDILTTLGTPLHPYFSILIPLLDGYCSLLPEHVIPAMFINPYIIPSSRYTAEWFPIPLVQHLLSVIPPPTPPTVEENLSESVDTIRGSDPDSKSTDNGPGILDVMDVRKWNWPGYLTFGKNSSKSSSPPAQEEEAKANEEDSSPGETTPESTVASVQEDPRREESNTQVEVDPSALEDALSSDGISISSKTLRQQSAANTIKQVPSSQWGR